MPSPDTNTVLNRLLAIHYRSLAMYLGYAPPWRANGQDEAGRVLERIVVNQKRMVDRFGQAVLDSGGMVSYGEFPMLFTAYHDVSFDFLLKILLERQQKEVGVIEKYVDLLSGSPVVQALAQEALGESKAHLDMLVDLKKPSLAQFVRGCYGDRETASEVDARAVRPARLRFREPFAVRRYPCYATSMRLFDTHAHLNDEAFADHLPDVVARANAAGVERILVVGTTAATSRTAVEIAQRFEGLYAAVGIQPNYVAEAQAGDWEEIVSLAQQPKVAALGETGLDRYWDNAPFDLQQDYFDRHLRLSQATGLPFVVHMRECGEDVAAMLRDARSRGELRGVMHSFTGDLPLAQECLSLGLYISFAGMVTYKKSEDLRRRVAAEIPADRILIETDSPYLSPQPHRGVRRNEPALVVHTAACLAEVRGVELATFAEHTWSNSLALFGQ